MDYLFYNSLILFSDENKEKIKNTKVSIAGAGGVGCSAIEMLARLGINNFKIADNDTYCENNMNRQIFATKNTIGRNKAEVAKERILSINPECNVKIYKDGVTLDNVEEFCKNSDFILPLNDTESVKVILHKIAKKYKIPVIMGSRASIDSASRWCVCSRLWDYKNDKEKLTFGSTNHPEFDKYSIDKLTPEMLHNYDKKIKQKKIKIFSRLADNSKEDLFKTISKKELSEKIKNNPDSYNRHVCSVIANIAGCLAATLTLRYIIGNIKESLQIELM